MTDIEREALQANAEVWRLWRKAEPSENALLSLLAQTASTHIDTAVLMQEHHQNPEGVKRHFKAAIACRAMAIAHHEAQTTQTGVNAK